MYKAGLVLEGGGLRGVFTSGVLDFFLDNDIQFPYVIGVSAGACNEVSYFAKQRGRAKDCNIKLYEEYKYIGLKNIFKKGTFIDYELLFNDFPRKIIPLDYKAYFENKAKALYVASNCITGKADYLEESFDSERLNRIVQASSSLPFLSKIAYVDGIPYLDGGVCDAVPVRKALDDGCQKIIVVLTRNKGYRKGNNSFLIPDFIYWRYPEIRRALKNKNADYNKVMDYIDKLESDGSLLVIRPEKKLEVSRLEKDIDKLEELYQQGYECGEKAFADNPSFFDF